MSRIRYLKPDFFSDEDVAELSFPARLLFQGLWTIADREGRLEDRPSWIRVLIFPYDGAISIGELLDELAKPRKHSVGGFIERYAVGEQRFIQIKNFAKHQKPHHKESSSVIPPPARPGKVRASRGKVGADPEKVGADPGKASLDRPVNGEWVMGNGNGEGKGTDPAFLPPPDVRAENAIHSERVRFERELLGLVGTIAEKLNRDPPDVMREVTAYKAANDGRLITGRVNPALLSDERLTKSLADAKGWLEDLEKPKAVVSQ